MNDNIDPQDGAPGSEEEIGRLLQEANAAALAGDPMAMLVALYKSHVLDGICRRLAAAWSVIAFEDIQILVGEAVDVLYQKVHAGEKIRKIIPFLLKVCSRKAYDFYERQRVVEAVDQPELEKAAGEEAGREFARDQNQGDEPSRDEPGADLDFEDKKRIALRIARGLLPRLGQQRIQDVMGYILDAIEAGHEDISNEDIEAALGLSSETVRTAKSRGFSRLSRIAKQEKLLPDDFDLLGLEGESEESE
jgi:DNA-directed RNA polymerase specialized sigma24 family protein